MLVTCQKAATPSKQQGACSSTPVKLPGDGEDDEGWVDAREAVEGGLNDAVGFGVRGRRLPEDEEHDLGHGNEHP